jgi:hypothetical protein
MKILQKLTLALSVLTFAACSTDDTLLPATIEIKGAAPANEAVQATVVTAENYSSSPNFRRITLQNFMGVNYVRSVWLKAVLT